MLSISLVAQAQEFDFKKGDFLVEGTLQATVEEGGMETLEKKSSFGFLPQLHYFVGDKWSVGAFGGFGNSKFENKPEASTWQYGTSYFTFGLAGRYYFLDLGKRFKTFAALQASFIKTKPDDIQEFDFLDQKQYQTSAGIGANFFLTKNITIAYTFTNVMGFNHNRYDDEYVSDSFFLNVNNFSNIFSAGAFSLGFKF